MFIIVALVAATGNIAWLNFWTELSVGLIVVAVGLLFNGEYSKKGKNENKPQGYHPQPYQPQGQTLQNNTTINNSPNAVIQVINSEKKQNEENSEKA